MDKTSTRFSTRLREKRKAAKVTLRRASKLAKVHLLTWWRWENGILEPRVGMLDTIAKIVDCNPKDLV